MQRTGAVCQKAAAPLKAIGVTVSEESIRAYLEDLNHRGRREETVRFYAAKLKNICGCCLLPGRWKRSEHIFW